MTIRRITENISSQINQPDTSAAADQAAASSSGISEVSDSIEQGSFASFTSEMASNGGAVDPNALVQYVLRESYMQTTEDLRSFAEKVKYFNEQKAALRDQLSQAGLMTDALKSGFEDPSASNPMEVVFETLRQSIHDANENKQYYLNQAQELVQLEKNFVVSTERKSDTKSSSDDD